MRRASTVMGSEVSALIAGSASFKPLARVMSPPHSPGFSIATMGSSRSFLAMYADSCPVEFPRPRLPAKQQGDVDDSAIGVDLARAARTLDSQSFVNDPHCRRHIAI